jgi:hypothetical protein
MWSVRWLSGLPLSRDLATRANEVAVGLFAAGVGKVSLHDTLWWQLRESRAFVLAFISAVSLVFAFTSKLTSVIPGLTLVVFHALVLTVAYWACRLIPGARKLSRRGSGYTSTSNGIVGWFELAVRHGTAGWVGWIRNQLALTWDAKVFWASGHTSEKAMLSIVTGAFAVTAIKPGLPLSV